MEVDQGSLKIFQREGKNILQVNNNVDLHKIKIENETENFKIQKIPNKLVREIIDVRNIKKITQKLKPTHHFFHYIFYNRIVDCMVFYIIIFIFCVHSR